MGGRAGVRRRREVVWFTWDCVEPGTQTRVQCSSCCDGPQRHLYSFQLVLWLQVQVNSLETVKNHQSGTPESQMKRKYVPQESDKEKNQNLELEWALGVNKFFPFLFQ